MENKTTTAPGVTRWYIRCHGCLSIAAVEINPTASYGDARKGIAPRKAMECALCEVEVENMGRVRRSYLVTHTAEICACDGRCTGARGPSCDCPCGGENHGTGATVTVEYTAGIPRATCLDRAAAIARRDEVAALIEAVKVAAPGERACYAAKQRGEYLSAGEYAAFCRYVRTLSGIAHARKLKSHSGRIKALRAMLPVAVAT